MSYPGQLFSFQSPTLLLATQRARLQAANRGAALLQLTDPELRASQGGPRAHVRESEKISPRPATLLDMSI